MSDDGNAHVQQIRESLARVIANAVTIADRLDLPDVAAILREAEDTAKGEAEGSQQLDRRFTLR